MKSLTINYVSKLEDIDLLETARYFERNQVFEYIDMLNWPTQFPYKPISQFKLARSSKSLFIYFKTIEQSIRALYSTDQESVWEDSCVEFFCKSPKHDYYFNFEFNCIGTCLATKRKGRDIDVQTLSTSKMNSIKRFASLGNKTFDEKTGNFEWKLTVEIPFEVMDIQTENLPERLLANFYKCADGTDVPHYLSWSQIQSKFPDFHQPDYFGELYLKNE